MAILKYNNNILNFNNRIIDLSVVPASVSGTPYQLLSTISQTLINNISLIRNNNFFSYSLDGPTLTTTFNQSPYFILDGGSDMFDGGNYTAPWLKNNFNYTTGNTIPLNIALPYSATSLTITDTDFNYISLGYSTSPDRRPLTLLGSRSSSGTIGFQKAGNIGADGLGSYSSSTIYNGSILSGFTVYAFVRQTYGQSLDPTICDLYMLIGHANWNTNFGSVVFRPNTSTQIQGAFAVASGNSASNVLAITTLLSGPSPNIVPTSAVTQVVNNYVTLIKQSLNY